MRRQLKAARTRSPRRSIGLKSPASLDERGYAITPPLLDRGESAAASPRSIRGKTFFAAA